MCGSRAEDSGKFLTQLLRISKENYPAAADKKKIASRAPEASGKKTLPAPGEQGPPARFTSEPPCPEGKPENPYRIRGKIHRHDIDQKASGTNEKDPG